jgi:hypothetical protein
MKRFNQYFILLLVFSVVFITHFFSKNITSFDSMWSIYTAMSIIKEGNTDLNEYKEALEKMNLTILEKEKVERWRMRFPNFEKYKYFGVEEINGHYYSIFPIGVSLIAVPFVYGIDKCLSFFPEDFIRSRLNYPHGVINVVRFHAQIELFIASLIIALTAVFIYLIARLFLERKYSLLVTFIFAFCTSAWSTASRGLWQHGPSMLMLTIALYIILRAKERPWLIQFASLPLALSYVIRPTNSIPIFLLTILVLIQYRQYFLRYLLWAMIIAIPFFIYNFKVYHSFLSEYYLPQRIGTSKHFFEALALNLFSPGRGLFIFSPILLFSIYGMLLKVKNNQADKLDYFLPGIIFLHWLAISSFGAAWWGGHTFGPRFFSDMIPYFIYFLIPVIAEIPKLKGMRKTALVSVLLFFITISFFIHYRGANSPDVYTWNKKPVDVALHRERLWDWKDIQFLRGLK